MYGRKYDIPVCTIDESTTTAFFPYIMTVTSAIFVSVLKSLSRSYDTSNLLHLTVTLSKDACNVSLSGTNTDFIADRIKSGNPDIAVTTLSKYPFNFSATPVGMSLILEAMLSSQSVTLDSQPPLSLSSLLPPLSPPEEPLPPALLVLPFLEKPLYR